MTVYEALDVMVNFAILVVTVFLVVISLNEKK